PVDLGQIIRASLESVHEMAVEKGVKLFSELTSGSILLLGDATRLEQVVMNLLVNGIKYTDAGGRITVGCMTVGDEVELAVRDTGIGIHPAFLEQIFQPFRRGTTSWL